MAKSKADRKIERIVVPVSAQMKVLADQKAREQGTDVSKVVRMFLEKWLGDGR